VGGGQGERICVPGGDQPAAATVGALGSNAGEEGWEEGSVFLGFEGSELRLLEANDRGGGDRDSVFDNRALIWITKPLDVPKQKTEIFDRHTIH
jgi:hypothetical protein